MSDEATLDRAAAMLGDRARRNVPIGPRTTYRVGGAAALFVELGDDADLELVVDVVGATGVDVLVIGKGSNLLVADRGYPGLALVLGDAFAEIDVDGTRVRAGAAASLPVVARRTVRAGLAGFEWAVGVPGSIGGAVRMNAGGHGSDMAASLARVRVIDLRTREDGVMQAGALDLGYRQSVLAAHQVVVWAELELVAGSVDAGERELAEIVAWRHANQPGGQNAGSVFTNPPGDSAGRLIDLAGCKGLRHGSAEVSPKHANFIQADEHGSADDVAALMATVQARVLATTGVSLVPETRLAGFHPANPAVEVDGCAARAGVIERPGIDPRIRARRIEVARSAGRRRLLRVLELGLVVAVAAGFVAALRSPLLDVDEIRVATGEHTGTQQVLDAAGIAPGDQLLDIDLAAAGRRVAQLPWVERVELGREIGGSVSIRVVERTPAALIPSDEGPLAVDHRGKVLAPAGDLGPSAQTLVQVAGAPVSASPGTVLDPALRPAIDLAAHLATAVPGAAAEVVPGDELTISLRRGGIVRFGDSSRLDAKLVSLDTVLDRVDLTCLAVLDLRLPGNPVLTREPACS